MNLHNVMESFYILVCMYCQKDLALMTLIRKVAAICAVLLLCVCTYLVCSTYSVAVCFRYLHTLSLPSRYSQKVFEEKAKAHGRVEKERKEE